MPLPLTTSAGSHPLGADEERPTKRQKPNQPSNPMELAIQALKDAANAEVAKEWEIFAKEKAQHEDVMKAALELVGLLETTYIEWSSETLSETLGGIVEAMKRKRKK